MMNNKGEHRDAATPVRGTWIIGALVVLALAGIRTITLGSTWLHLATGKFISEHGIPRTASWSLTDGDRTWIAETWLYDWILHKLWAIGPGAVTIIHVLLVVAAFLLLLPQATTFARGIAPALGIFLGTWLLLPLMEVSPRIFCLIFPAIFIFLLSRQRSATVFWGSLVVAQIFWTNMHASFLIGPVLCAVFAFQAYRTDTSPYAVKQLIAATVVTALVTLINPYFHELHLHAATLYKAPGFMSNPEMISPFHAQFGNDFLKNLTPVVLVVGAIGLATYRRKLPAALTCIAVGAAAVTAAAKGGSAFAPTMTILTFPFLCLSISAGSEFLGDAVKKRGDVPESVHSAFGTALAAVLLVVTLGMVVTNQYYRSIGSAASFGLGVNHDTVPERAASVISHPSFPERAANLPLDGGYLAYTYPERKIFTDQRPRGHDMAFHRSFWTAISSSSKEAQAFWIDHDINAFILNTVWDRANAALIQLISSGIWSLVYLDGTTAILIRNTPEHATFFNAVAMEREAGLQTIQDTYTAYREKIQSTLGAPVNARLLGTGNTFFPLQRYREAFAALDPVVLNAPSYHKGWYMLGLCQLQLGKTDRAVSSLEQACDGDPDSATAWLWLSQAYADAGKNSSAAVAFSQALELNPEEAEKFGDPVGPGTGSPSRP